MSAMIYVYTFKKFKIIEKSCRSTSQIEIRYELAAPRLEGNSIVNSTFLYYRDSCCLRVGFLFMFTF